jgi:hypothetical protein
MGRTPGVRQHQLTCTGGDPNFEPVWRLCVDHCGETTVPAKGVDLS